jgi:hypothetical protein
VALALVRYWAMHLSACDTAEGIHRWWLGMRPDISVGDVELALRTLEDRDIVEGIPTTDGRAIYRLRAGIDSALLTNIDMDDLARRPSNERDASNDDDGDPS